MRTLLAKRFTGVEMAAMRREAEEADGTGEVPRGFWEKLRRVGRGIPFARDLLAAYFCVLDPATPSRVKLVLAGAIAYFVLPLDGIPDVLPLLGFADDAAMLAAALTQVAGSVTDVHRQKADAALTSL